MVKTDSWDSFFFNEVEYSGNVLRVSFINGEAQPYFSADEAGERDRTKYIEQSERHIPKLTRDNTNDRKGGI